MTGRNPYLSEADISRPKSPYRLTIVDEQNREHVIEVEPGKIPYNDHGLPGSILEIALGHGVALNHACGGVCACATCHVHVVASREGLNPPTENEEDQLEQACDLRSDSRLACRCVPNGTTDVTIRIPSWNRNLARE